MHDCTQLPISCNKFNLSTSGGIVEPETRSEHLCKRSLINLSKVKQVTNHLSQAIFKAYDFGQWSVTENNESWNRQPSLSLNQ